MTDGHGGARTPSQPAPVSGPGQHSARTDGGPAQQHAQALRAPTGMDYGDHQAMIASERLAPLAQATMPTPPSPAPTGGTAVAATGTPAAPGYAGGPFGAPSAQPNVPVTNGAAIGPGAGSEAMTLPQGSAPQTTGAMTQMLQKMSATDTTGVLGQLYQLARARGV